MSNIFNPVSTYRVQFHKDFNFSAFERIIPYLKRLGIRTVYASPVFEASPGSTHGYDGTDPNNINPELGTEDQLRRISKELGKHNISWLQDIVPNHLSYHENNKWLMDVLEKGEASEHARVFDIIWDHPDYPGKLMVPFPGSDLEKLLKDRFPNEEHFALCSWQETDYRMNYRRFFLVNTLICTNIHFDDVFDKYHQLIKKLTAEGVFQGLRVDHVDGLYDPTKYLHDLRKLAGPESYIIVEKILEPNEKMPEYWPVQGNSGYDFLAMVNNLFTNRAAEYAFTSFYYDLSGNGTPVEQQIPEKKRMILQQFMRGELENLVRLHKKVSGDQHVNDDELRNDIAEYLIHCPVYRYYQNLPMMDADKNRNPESMKPFYQRCMQFTGPLMAKGVEDTLMYTYNRFIGHNEVGDSPEFFGYTAEEFHELMIDRRKNWPLGMNASSTHDTKRGEDVRARLNAVTDLHQEWIELVTAWRKHNGSLKKENSPDANDEYFIYQTLVGSYPVTSDGVLDKQEKENYQARIKDYLQKSLREAKVHSTWTEQNTVYEDACISFANALIDGKNDFHSSFLPFAQKVSDYGMINSFAQQVLKFTCPGVPDVYQGTELWDLSLVDPDNRRPINYELRTELLSKASDLQYLWSSRADGAVKLQLLYRLLNIRSEYNSIFTEGMYVPAKVSGQYADNVFAFMRTHESGTILVAVPLHYAQVKSYDAANFLNADWENTIVELPESESGSWRNLLSGTNSPFQAGVNSQKLFENFPVAIWLRES